MLTHIVYKLSDLNGLAKRQRHTTRFTCCAAAVPWLLACSATPRQKITDGAQLFELHFARRREALRAQKWLAAKTPPAIFVR